MGVGGWEWFLFGWVRVDRDWGNLGIWSSGGCRHVGVAVVRMLAVVVAVVVTVVVIVVVGAIRRAYRAQQQWRRPCCTPFPSQ